MIFTACALLQNLMLCSNNTFMFLRILSMKKQKDEESISERGSWLALGVIIYLFHNFTLFRLPDSISRQISK